MASEPPKESPSENPGHHTHPDEATKGYFMQQTDDHEFKGYHNGNSDPCGFGIKVDDTYKACERFERLGVEFVKKPEDGKMKGIAFTKDADGYWIEIFDLKTIGNITAEAD